MSKDQKIVDLQHSPTAEEEQNVQGAHSIADGDKADSSYPDIGVTANSAEEEYAVAEESDWDWEDNAETPAQSDNVIKFAFVAAALVWTGILTWSKLPKIEAGLGMEQGVDMFVQWSIPILLLAVTYLLLIRNSTREAGVFGNVAASLRAESQALEARLHHMNGELSLAREFLANQSLELESLGRTSSDTLLGHAEKIQNIISDSDVKVRSIGDVSDSALTNIEKLREQLPVISTSAKDVTSQIANTGRTAQLQIHEMAQGFERVNEFGKTSDGQIMSLQERAHKAISDLSEAMENMSGSVDAKLAHISDTSGKTFQSLEENSEALTSRLHGNVTLVRAEQDAAVVLMREQLESHEETLTRLAENREQQDAAMSEMLSAMRALLDESEARIAEIDSSGGDKTAKVAFAISALGDNLDEVLQKMLASQDRSQQLFDEAEKLKHTVDANIRDIDETLPASLTQLDERLSQTVAGFQDARAQLDEISNVNTAFAEKVQTAHDSLNAQAETISGLNNDNDVWNRQNAEVTALIASMQSAREESEALSASANDTLAAALAHVQTTAEKAAQAARAAMQDSIGSVANDFGDKSEQALEQVIHGKASELVGNLEGAINQAIDATHDATVHLKEQLAKVDELATDLEYRVQEARQKAETKTDHDFARRVSLLTESLNSTAIDVTKIFSTEVTDTAWAAYLKGDRGVFTRRAVKLLDAGEVREIAQHYENDMEFQGHVNRYIHDFEAMLRSMLATSEGGAVSVTLLSSDIGKLYVALAQAIERFRK